jgi:hypothetical protein
LLFKGVTFKKIKSIIDYHVITLQKERNCILVG